MLAWIEIIVTSFACFPVPRLAMHGTHFRAPKSQNKHPSNASVNANVSPISMPSMHIFGAKISLAHF